MASTNKTDLLKLPQWQDMEYLTEIAINLNDSIDKVLFAKEGDKNTRGLLIQLLNNNKVVDTTNMIVELFAKDIKGNIYKSTGEPINEKEGLYKVIFTQEMLVPPQIECELRFRFGNESGATSLPFIVKVGDSLWY